MCSNVLPSAPIYPDLPQHDFRLQKANEVSAALNAEVVHYRGVAKKYKRAKKAANWSATGFSVFSALLSGAGIASALTLVGLPASASLAGLGGVFAGVSAGILFASKKLDSKIKKHQEIVTLAIAKRDTVDRLLSKALVDNQISDDEFQLLMAEFSQYNLLKDSVRAKLTHQSSRPDLEKIKKDVRDEMETEFQAKKNQLIAALS